MHRSFFVGALALALAGALFTAPVIGTAYAEETLDSDQKILFPGLSNAREAAGLPPQLQPTGERQIKILEIENVSGNDPFNEEQPLLNFNGQVVGSVPELLATIEGNNNDNNNNNNGGDDGNDNGNVDDLICNVATITSGVFSQRLNDNGNDIAQASIDLTGATLRCILFANAGGNLLVINYPAVDQSGAIAQFDFNFFSAFAPFNGGFQLLTPTQDPRGVGINAAFFNLGNQVMILQETATGNVFTVELNVTRVAGAEGVGQNGAGRDVPVIVETPVFTLTVTRLQQGGL